MCGSRLYHQASKTKPCLTGADLLLRLQWVGIIFLSIISTSLGRLAVTATAHRADTERLAVRLIYCLVGFLILLGLGLLVGSLVVDGKPAPHLRRTFWTDFFTVYYIGIMIWAGYNFVRAFARMLTRSGQRRMLYLMAGATAPALGSYPYLLFGFDIAARYPLMFWSVALIINLLVAGLVITMAYAVAFSVSHGLTAW
jgi:cation transport ATPase